ncbi:hypothetical protein ASE02_07885 [Phenylobacterium sp. Root700]|nr:hypothetical protein ASE02_07885 [Phenylobacterium sp. Root700]
MAGAGAGAGAGVGAWGAGLGAACGISEPLRIPDGRAAGVGENAAARGAGAWAGAGRGRISGAVRSAALGNGPMLIGFWDGIRPQGLERVKGLSSWSGGGIDDLQRRSVGAGQV